jgi:hypothetical protein
MTTDPAASPTDIEPVIVREIMHLDMCLALAQDFKRTTRYVAFDNRNYGVFSIEYIRLLLDACSEVESLLKLYCDDLAPGERQRIIKERTTANNPEPRLNIDDLRGIILAKPQSIASIGLSVFGRYTIGPPWKEWGDSPPANPSWWTAHNDLKHEQAAPFRHATLENVFGAMCGMMVLANKLFPAQYYWRYEQPWFKVL